MGGIRVGGREGGSRGRGYTYTYSWLMLLNCGVGEDSWVSLGHKRFKPVNPKGSQPWIFIGRTDAEAEAPILWPPDMKSWLIGKDPDAEKGWRHEEKKDGGWGGWMASLIQWTWIWASSGRLWRTRKPGRLQSTGLQRVGHNLAELNNNAVSLKKQKLL